MHDAAHRLREHVLAALVRVGAVEAEAGADRVDEARVDLLQLLVAEAHALHDAGAEIVDDDVGGLEQAQHDGLVARPVRRSSTIERLLRLSEQKTGPISPAGSFGNEVRERSPVAGRSILMTSAP